MTWWKWIIVDVPVAAWLYAGYLTFIAPIN